MAWIETIYPRSRSDRLPFSHPLLKAGRPKFFKAAILNFITLQLLFFGLFCYLFGALYQQETHTHNIDIVFVDYDQDLVGEAVRRAYKSLQSERFPTLVEHSIADYPTEASLREAVCRTDFWAAIYTTPGASGRLGRALSGANTVQYNKSNTLTYIWNEVRYPTVLDSAISGSLGTLSYAAQHEYVALNGTAALSGTVADEATLSLLTDPWDLSSVNIKRTTQGSRAVYNTLVIVLLLLQDFFYLATVNGLYGQFKVYSRAKPHLIIIVRTAISATYTLFGSILVAASIWIFKASWDVSATQFALTWLTLWLFAHANFMVIDVFTIWLPALYVPMALVSWVIFNVISIIIPFALSPSFYRWGYALPAHGAYEVLTDVWSGGCNPHLRFGLVVLFCYEVVGNALAALGVYRRSHLATPNQNVDQDMAESNKVTDVTKVAVTNA
ncbi:hypothetical protein NQ176_g761 [Zarea fungicola]|uniref:Uncharacterized protein n=1 Tax=Zarea fungicola TaxID=93591 RepID=A0ACC1NXY1_9HYPO|nr:hypothetical protein NQ176_g761 [Lecanicillium fungicola]